MTTKGIIWRDSQGNHVEIAYSDALTGSPLVFTDIPEARAVARNPEASPEVDFTSYDSTEQELKLGLPRRGSYDVTCVFVPDSATQQQVVTFDENKEERVWRIRQPKANVANQKRAEERFRAYVQVASINTTGALDNNATEFVFTLRVAGGYVYEKEAA